MSAEDGVDLVRGRDLAASHFLKSQGQIGSIVLRQQVLTATLSLVGQQYLYRFFLSGLRP